MDLETGWIRRDCFGFCYVFKAFELLNNKAPHSKSFENKLKFRVSSAKSHPGKESRISSIIFCQLCSGFYRKFESNSKPRNLWNVVNFWNVCSCISFGFKIYFYTFNFDHTVAHLCGKSLLPLLACLWGANQTSVCLQSFQLVIQTILGSVFASFSRLNSLFWSYVQD